MPVDHSASYLERWSDKRNADYLVELIPDADTRERVCGFLAESIRVCHSLDPNRWGMTRYSHLLRLNAGRAHAAVVVQGTVNLLVAAGAAQAFRPMPSAVKYPSVPLSRFVPVDLHPSSETEHKLEDLWSAHVQHLRAAIPLGVNGALRE